MLWNWNNFVEHNLCEQQAILATSRTSPSFLRRAKDSTQSAAKRWVSRNYILSRSIVLCFKVADCSRRTRSPKRDEEVPQTIHVHCSGHLRDVYLSQISLWKITSIWWYLQQRWGTKKPPQSTHCGRPTKTRADPSPRRKKGSILMNIYICTCEHIQINYKRVKGEVLIRIPEANMGYMDIT